MRVALWITRLHPGRQTDSQLVLILPLIFNELLRRR